MVNKLSVLLMRVGKERMVHLKQIPNFILKQKQKVVEYEIMLNIT